MKLLLSLLFLPLSQALKLQDGNCRLAVYAPFTDERVGPPAPHRYDEDREYYGYGQWKDAASLSKASFSLLAAAEMARDHFNNRNDLIVKEWSEIDGCSIQIPENNYYINSGYNRALTVTGILDIEAEAILAGQAREDCICAVVGPIDEGAHEALSSLTESHDIPQLAYATIHRRLSDDKQFPTFVRMIPEGTTFAESLGHYVQGDDIGLHRGHVAIIYDKSDYGELFEDPLEDIEDELSYRTLTEHFIEGDDESIESSLRDVVDQGWRTIILITDREAMLRAVAEQAEKLDLLGDGFFWLFPEAAFSKELVSTIKHDVDSPVDKLVRGAAVYSEWDNPSYQGESSMFYQAWRQQDQTLLDRVNAIIPISEDGVPFYQGSADYFQTENPTNYASYIYDAVIAAGFGACHAQMANNAPVAGDHREFILSSSFTGASDDVSFAMKEGKYTSDRDPAPQMFGMHNVQPADVVDGKQTYDLVLTSLSIPDRESGTRAWSNVEGTEFLFHDGTPEQPMPLRTVQENNWLSKGIRASGISLSSIAMFLAIVSGAWIIYKREHRAVKAYQPEFLLLVCFGSTLQASSLIFISFDESYGWSEEKLTRACQAFPWLFVSGYLFMYCGLCSKLWRLNKVLQMRRASISHRQIFTPFCVLILSSYIVLLVWTIHDPVVWDRYQISSDDAEEPLEMYGSCMFLTTDALLNYILPLGILFMFITCVTGYLAWQLSDVQEDLSDARWVFIGILVHMQIWLVGVPIVAITEDVSRDASYLMYAALTFTLSVGMVGVIVWPKMYVYVRDTYLGGPSKRISINTTGRRRSNITGLEIPESADGSVLSFSGNSASAEADAIRVQIATLQRRLSSIEAKDSANKSTDSLQPRDLAGSKDRKSKNSSSQQQGSSEGLNFPSSVDNEEA